MSEELKEYKVIQYKEAGKFFGVATGAGFSVLVILSLGMYGCPQYNVWEQGLSGQAQLAKAEQNRKILVEQARAEKESAQLRSDAITIVGQAAKDFPEYRYQEFLGAFAEALKEGAINQIIYVPTEANVPLMEAGKR